MRNISLDEIANRIVNVVLDSPYINKESLENKIRSILKIWIKQTDSFKSQKADLPRLQFTIEKEEFEKHFWKNQVKELVTEDKMQEYYQKSNKALEDSGFKKVES